MRAKEARRERQLRRKVQTRSPTKPLVPSGPTAQSALAVQTVQNDPRVDPARSQAGVIVSTSEAVAVQDTSKSRARGKSRVTPYERSKLARQNNFSPELNADETLSFKLTEKLAPVVVAKGTQQTIDWTVW